MNNNQQDALQDCRYILSLSEAALQSHLNAWLEQPSPEDISQMSKDDKEYSLTIKEIANKLGTTECLLTEEI